MRHALLVAFLLLATSAAVQAQTPTECLSPCAMKPAQAYTTVFEHDGQNVVGFRLYLRNPAGVETKIGNDILLSELVAGAKTVPLTAPTVTGDYAIIVGSFNAVGETKAPPYVLKIMGPPTAPKNLKIFITASIAVNRKGAVTFEIVGLSETDPTTK